MLNRFQPAQSLRGAFGQDRWRSAPPKKRSPNGGRLTMPWTPPEGVAGTALLAIFGCPLSSGPRFNRSSLELMQKSVQYSPDCDERSLQRKGRPGRESGMTNCACWRRLFPKGVPFFGPVEFGAANLPLKVEQAWQPTPVLENACNSISSTVCRLWDDGRAGE